MNRIEALKQLPIIVKYHPWYTLLLKQQNLAIAAVADLRELPLLTDERLAASYYHAEASLSAKERLSVFRTSGTSTGVRKAIYYSQGEDERYLANKIESFRDWLGGDLPSGVRALADLGTGHAAASALAIFERLGLQGEAIPFTLPIEEHIAKLREWRPHLLYTMPSILEAIADASPASNPSSLGIRKIVVVGEIAASEWQANMASRFGITTRDILDTYGSIEIGAIAAYSHELGAYLIAEDLYGEALPAEEIHPSFEPLRPNEGVLTLTSSSRRYFPALRFVTYDVVRDFRSIMVNGKKRQIFTCIAKRIGAELKHGEKISLYDIEAVVQRHLSDASFRVAMRDNRLQLHLHSKQLTEDKRLAIANDVAGEIPDIGMMIRNRLLEAIEVIPLKERSELPSGSVKGKKLYL
ncbi:hypothetical protein [Paenibacillus sp. HB172176]|uniref:hypothetical protein n=1 Tax=Paenibacillus sp. HB172176 TaxID=2493690 RepID=UPI001438D137|nr:hypothetical protein [Paenibacillus sp. HB172176]